MLYCSFYEISFIQATLPKKLKEDENNKSPYYIFITHCENIRVICLVLTIPGACLRIPELLLYLKIGKAFKKQMFP